MRFANTALNAVSIHAACCDADTYRESTPSTSPSYYNVCKPSKFNVDVPTSASALSKRKRTVTQLAYLTCSTRRAVLADRSNARSSPTPPSTRSRYDAGFCDADTSRARDQDWESNAPNIVHPHLRLHPTLVLAPGNARRDTRLRYSTCGGLNHNGESTPNFADTVDVSFVLLCT
ncbi:hypothetical protein NEOLEDRAFT_87313 [Neolentinus lepideus HHB14362 ss-1]|uniref:Uncharacterized protein n=1 Tax=Neolentinus lepideus HHB14362 ss-1 TaxID=1314782 RepID=A0A165MXX7_9AGAM|nr:hypothetical protein NEOLEDRAFT_87313 [Neolentinus lepideus HHB14362 ss-1]